MNQAYDELASLQQAVPSSLWAPTRQLCQDYHVPIQVIVALISVESDWNPRTRSFNASSKTWDLGLGQINDRNITAFAQDFLNKASFDPMNPSENLKVCIAHFSDLLSYFHGEVGKALIAYNVGINGMQKPRLYTIGARYRDRVYDRLLELRRRSS